MIQHVDTSSADQQPEFIEGIRLRVIPAPLLKRMVAFGIDIGIISAVIYGAILVMVLLAVAMSIPIAAAVHGNDLLKGIALFGGIALVVVILLAIASMTHIFFIYYEFKKGATPGKRLMGLRVVSLDGGPITKGQAIYRDFVRWYVDVLLVFPALISMFATKKKQRVGDLLANTVVVHSVASEDTLKFLYVNKDDYIVLLEHLHPKPVTYQMRADYLNVASQVLLLGSGAQLPQQADWLVRIRRHLEISEELELNDHTVLMFFAEYCFQEDLKLKQSER
jgi:uncharacterized RDD family membrane protein YckC